MTGRCGVQADPHFNAQAIEALHGMFIRGALVVGNGYWDWEERLAGTARGRSFLQSGFPGQIAGKPDCEKREIMWGWVTRGGARASLVPGYFRASRRDFGMVRCARGGRTRNGGIVEGWNGGVRDGGSTQGTG